MRKELEYIKETLDLNLDDIKKQPNITDELITADLLKLIGYDRRRVRNVKRIHQQNDLGYYWAIFSDDGTKVKFAVKTMPYSWDVTQPTPIPADTPCIILTNGHQLGVFGGAKAAKLIKTFELFSDDEGLEGLLDAMTNPADGLGNYLDNIVEAELRNSFESCVRNLDVRLISSNFCQQMKVTPEKVVEYLREILIQKESETGEDLNQAYGEVVQEKEKLLQENGELLAEVNNLKAQLDEAQQAAQAQTEENKSAEELEHALAEVKRLSGECDSLHEQVLTLKSEAGSLSNENSSLSEKVATLQDEISSKETEIGTLREENNSLAAALDEAKQRESELQDKLSTNSENNTETIQGATESSYRNQIVNLTNEVAKLQDEIAGKDEEIANLKEILSNKEDPRVTEAESLLATIEADENDTKGYVGVVEGSLYQAQTIEKFIGLSLQELYKNVTFELMQYLFDGDVFNISDSPVRNDFLIGNKMYDIDLSGLTEEDAIYRLKTLFSKFPNVVFRYKIIGSNPIITEEAEPVDEANTQANEQEYQESGASIIDNLPDEAPADAISVFMPFRSFENVCYNNEVEVEQLICLTNTENESTESLEIRNDSLDNTAIDLMTAVISFGRIKSKPKVIGTNRFEGVSDLIHPLTENDTVRIPYTRLGLTVTQITDIFPVIEYLCSILQVDVNGLTIYFNGSIYTDEEQMYQLNIQSIYSSDIPHPIETGLYQGSKDGSNTNHSSSIISGNMSSYLYPSDTLADVQDTVVHKVLAVKSGELSMAFRAQMGDNDIANLISEMLAVSDAPIDEVILKLGNFGVTNPLSGEVKYYPVISRDQSLVTPNFETFDNNGDTYYVSELKPYQLMNVLLRIRMLANGDRNIGVRVLVDNEAISYYCNEFHAKTPVEQCSVESFIDYVMEHIKS